MSFTDKEYEEHFPPMTDNLLPLSREELDKYNKNLPKEYEVIHTLITQARTALDLQEANNEMIEVIKDSMSHHVNDNDCIGDKKCMWCVRAEKAIQSARSKEESK